MKRLAILIVFIACSALGDIHYVWTNSPSPEAPYTNWLKAAHSIQDAVDAATNSCTVLVTNGTYILPLSVYLFDPVTLRSVNGRDVTILDGGYPKYTNICLSGTGSAVVEGFTIRNGNGSGTSGGGVSRCAVTNCIIENNSARDGGGVSSSSIYNCIIRNNYASRHGGGAFSCGVILNSTILSNSASGLGGGLYECGLVRHSRIEDNSATAAGGVFTMSHGGTALEYCLIAGNTATAGNGGGIYALNQGGSFVRNCTVVSNTTSSTDYVHGAIYGDDDDAYVTVDNCIFLDNWPSDGFHSDIVCSYSCATGLIHDVSGNITNLPSFVDPNTGDYRLTAGSPCIDSGLSWQRAGASNDLAGVPYPLDGDNNGGSVVDLGCYEYVHAFADSDGDTASDANEIRAYTDPTDGESVLGMTDMSIEAGGLRVNWRGGVEALQVIERSTNLASNSWEPVYTNEPPTATNENWTDSDGTNHPAVFYRIEIP